METKNLKKNYPLYPSYPSDNFRAMMESSARLYGDRIAFSFRNNPKDTEIIRVSFNETRDRVRDLATGLIALGVRGTKVALIGEMSYDWTCAYFALMASGSVNVPIDRELPVEDITGIIRRAECTVVIYSKAYEEKIAEVRAALGEDTRYITMNGESPDWSTEIASIAADGAERVAAGDTAYYDYPLDGDALATIVFTSGTTGKGKGVMLTQKNILMDMSQGMYNFTISDKTLFVLPPHHTYGSTVNLVGHYMLGCEIYISSGVRYLLNEMKEQKPKHLILVPLFVETLHKKIWQMAEKSGKAELLRKAIPLSNGLRKIGVDLRRKIFKDVLSAFGGELQMVICGGAALNQSIIDTFEAFGIVILNGYGITECAPLISANRNQWRKPGSVGCPIVGEEVKIASPDENGEGEICVKGPNVMLGYYNDPEATAAVFDEDGFFHTGDWGKLDEDGWIYITGRIKNIIILSNGKNVYPEEIEARVSAIPGVAEVVVYAGESKNEQREIIVAEIFPDAEVMEKNGITDAKAYFSEEIKKINETSAPYKAIGHIKIRAEEFVKNTSRKITRFNLDKSID